MELISDSHELVLAFTTSKYKVREATVQSLSDFKARLRETAVTNDTKQPTTSPEISSENERELLVEQLDKVLRCPKTRLPQSLLTAT